MKKTIKSSMLIAYMSLSYGAAANNAEFSNHVELKNFDCAKEFESQIEILGRGSNYPSFIASDILEELIKQDEASQLISATCTSEVELGIKSIKIKNNGENATAIDYLEAKFPMELVVFNGEENWILDAAIKYEVNGLVSKQTPKLTKHFIVNGSYDMNRVKLKELPLILQQ
ncbi:hypothetical protein [Agaribacter flavus]|uniref:Uncharacterized protein n=1 Tax=Agaribacter flavus TaxID=1902781 RepID=A0ABV7FNR7_9ALTE